jgi:orotate phosphoribosyltransferase
MGATNRIEGRLEPGWKTVVVEDLISTGGSAIETVEALSRGGRGGSGHRRIFTYGMRMGFDQMRKRVSERLADRL